ncbi:exosporium protein C [Cohnella rhizosphaerae]|uniref:Exosporium protein C n=1 Tax=Cohnella rhizosphaerae TaxID=1457232 RepID=A0A9X4QUG0_9BACL|nr:exosporium protein C [Cohnella rhizosphaerae]MDG0812231.1 exosporium protein C [Cohnella rhizosphaerae]
MSNDLLDYKASVPSSVLGGTAPLTIPVAPGLQLANLGIFIVPPVPLSNRVELKGTVGIQATAGNPAITIRVFRVPDNVGSGIQIFSKALNVESGALAERFYTASFSTIDFNVAAATGFIVYNLTIEASAAASANVIGPITFTGLAIGNV